MNNEIRIFENEQFGKVRTLLIDGQPWFVGKDVGKALGYSNTRDALSKHVDAEDKTTVAICDTGSNYKSQAVIINESGVYSLIFSSKLEGARQFKRWVTSEVLPSIRKYGAYLTEEALARVTGDTSEAEKLFTELKKEKLRVKQLQKECDSLERLMAVTREANELLSTTNELLEKRVEVLEPKASYYDSVLDSEELIPISLIAEDYGLTAQKLNGLLHGFGIQHPVGKSWAINREYLDMGYTQTKVLKYGTETITVTYWTQKGKKFIYEFLKELGIVPLNERKSA